MQVEGDVRATILDRQWQSFAGAHTLPDPSSMSKYHHHSFIFLHDPHNHLLVPFSIDQTQTKFASIEKDRLRVGDRMGGRATTAMGASAENFRGTGFTTMNGFRRNNGWIQ